MSECPICESWDDPESFDYINGIPCCSRIATIQQFVLQSLHGSNNAPDLSKNIDSVPAVLKPKDPLDPARDKFKELQDLIGEKIRRFEFDIEVFIHEEEERSQQAFQKNTVFHQEIPALKDQLEEFEITPEYIEAYEKEDQLDYAFENNTDLIQQQEIFKKIHQDSIKETQEFGDSILRSWRNLGLKLLTPGLIEKVLSMYSSKAEGKLEITKAMRLFRLEIGELEQLVVSAYKEEEWNEEFTFEKINSFDKMELRIEGESSLEAMILWMNFLFEDCLEKVNFLMVNFCKRYISNQEVERLGNADFWKSQKIKALQVNLADCTFEEGGETLLILFRNGLIQLDKLEEIKLFLASTEPSSNILDIFAKLIVPRMTSLKIFGLDVQNMPVTDVDISCILWGNISILKNLEELRIDLRKTGFTDQGALELSEKIIPNMKSLHELRLFLEDTLLTDQGWSAIFKSIKENLGSRLKALALGFTQNNVTDSSFEEFACEVLPSLVNLEDFRVWIDQNTIITEKSLVPLCRNIKSFASKLKNLVLGLEGSTASDEMMNVFALETVPFLNKLEQFYIFIGGTKITDTSLINLYSAAATSKVFANIQRFNLDPSENPISDESLKVFASQVLPTMTKLKEFTFYANQTKIKDLKDLFLNLFVAKAQLHHLTLSLNGNEIEDQSVIALAETLSSLTKLNEISIYLNQTKLGDLSIGPLLASLKPIAKRLKRLDLGFNDTQITDEAISILGDEVAPELKNLKEFRLWFGNTKVGDSGVKSLFKNLKETMKSMKIVELVMGNTMITDESLLVLAEESLSKIENLQAFELWVAENKNISDISLVPLMSSLQKSVSSINKLVFSLQKTDISNTTLTALNKHVMKNLMNLKDFQLFLGQTGVSDSSMIPFFNTLADKVQGVRSLELELDASTTDTSIAVFASKVLPNMIRMQDLKFYWTGDLSDSTYRDLCLNAKKAIKNIKTFTISKSNFFITTDLLTPPEKCLKEVHFELNQCEITDSSMELILRSFENQVSQVKHFSWLMSQTQVSNGSLIALGETFFAFMPNLETLKIELHNAQFTETAFCKMCSALEQCASNLKLFKLNMFDASVGHESMLALAKSGLAHMKSLKELEFYFSTNDNIGEGFKFVFTEMQHCAENLQSFILCVPAVTLPTETLEVFATQTFPKLKSLTSLNIAICQTIFTIEGFGLFFSGLKEIARNLENLTLTLYEEAISDQTLDLFSVEVLPLLSNLKSFRFFLYYGKIGDESFIRFNKRFQESESQVTDFLLECKQTSISNEGLNEFALRTLPTMKNLQTLEMNFEENSVDDESIVNLFEGLGEIAGGLRTLSLSLQSTGLTDVGVVGFKEKLAEKIGGLEKLTLDFSENNISEDSKDYINDMMMMINNK